MPRYIPYPFYPIPKTSCGFSGLLDIPFIDDLLLYLIYLLLLWIIQWIAVSHIFEFLIELLHVLMALLKNILEGKRSIADFYEVVCPYLPKLKILAKRFLFIAFLYILLLLIGHLLSLVTPSQFAKFWKMLKPEKLLEIRAAPHAPGPDPLSAIIDWIKSFFVSKE